MKTSWLRFTRNRTLRPLLGASLAIATALLLGGSACGGDAIPRPALTATAPAPVTQAGVPSQGVQAVAATQLAGRVPASSAGTIDVCALIAQADVEALLGGPLDLAPQSKQSISGASNCSYGAKVGTGLRVVTMSVYRAGDKGATGTIDPAKLYNDSKRLYAQTQKPVAGLGDQAFVAGGAGTMMSVHVLKQSRYLSIASNAWTDDATMAQTLEQLAAKALANL